MAIPVHEVADLLAGRPVSVVLNTTSDKKGSARVECTVTFADPLKRLTAASVLVIPMDQVKEPPQVDKNGGFARLAPAMKDYPLTLKDGAGTTTFAARSVGNEATVSYYVQVRSTSSAEAQRHWEWPWVAIDVSGAGKATVAASFGEPRHGKPKQDEDREASPAKDAEDKPAEKP
jgi:hypothetical protein